MTREEIEAFIEKEMPGWHLAKDAEIMEKDPNYLAVVVETESARKIVVIHSGRIRELEVKPDARP